MELKIIDFFPMEKNDEKQILSGTIKIELPNEGIIISGISVFKKKESWFFNLPSRGDGTDPDSGKAVRYLTFSFLEREKNNQLIRALREKVPIFIEQQLADKENPLIFHKRQQKVLKQTEVHKTQDKPIMTKETPPIEKPKPIQSIASKEWRDLPPLQQKPTARYLSKFGR